MKPGVLKALRIGIVTDGLLERVANGTVQIRNGGVGVYIYNLVKHLQLIDSTNEYFLIRLGAGALDIYRGERTHCVFLPGSPLATLGIATRRAVMRLGLDVVHYPNQFGGTLLPAQLRRVVTLHDLTPLLFPHFHPWRRVLGYRLFLRPALRAAHHIIVDAARTRTDLVERGIAPAHKITVVPLGAATSFARGVRTDGFRQRYDLPERYILNVGVLEPRKNHGLLLHALAHLHRVGEDISLVIVGRDGWNWTDPLDTPSLSHLRSWVRIVRNVPDADLPEFYSRATLFAYPSLYEGFGLPVVEAMASGTPVIASRASSLPEVAGEAALYADPGDAENFASTLLAVLRDAELRERLVAAGLRRARDLSWRTTAERTLAIYRQVLESDSLTSAAPSATPAAPAR